MWLAKLHALDIWSYSPSYSAIQHFYIILFFLFVRSFHMFFRFSYVLQHKTLIFYIIFLIFFWVFLFFCNFATEIVNGHVRLS